MITGNNSSNNLYIAALPDGNTTALVNQGKGKYSQAAPIDFYSVESEVQSLYYANELGMTKGSIGSITIYPHMASEYLSEPFEVYIAETDRENYDDGLFEPYTNMTKVFEGAAYFPAGDTEFVIPFNSSYDYKGGNLIVCTRKLGKEFINSKKFLIRECEEVRTIYAATDNTGTLEDDKLKHASGIRAIAQMKFNRVSAPSGTITGTVTDSKGAVKDADVKVEGTRVHVLTDASGRYTITGVAAEPQNIEVKCHGYYTSSGNAVTVTASADATKDIKITELPRYKVSGTVTSKASSEVLEGVRIDLRGYDDFVAYTGANGRYEISGVCGEEGFDYNLRVSDGYFDAFAKKISIKNDVTANAALNERVLPATDVTASQSDGKISVSWKQALPEVRHDSGLRNGCLGYPEGWREVIMGQAIREPMVIEELRWFVTNEEAAHSNFNVIILGLKVDGTPDGNNVIYEDYGVDYVDNAWTKYRLREPLRTDGCLVAISCNGFLGIGMCPSTPEYPLEPGMYYYAGTSYSMEMGIWDMTATSYNSTLMIRAYGYRLDDKGSPVVNPRTPSGGYKVLRLPYQEENAANWTSVGTTRETGLVDNTAFEAGRYRYAVVASYKSGDAEAVLSSPVDLSGSGIDDITGDTEVRVEGNSIIVPEGARIFTLSGIRVDGRNLAPGIYLVNTGKATLKVAIR